MSGDYGDGGGYQLISPANDGPVDHASTSVRRNGQLRVEYAPSASFSTFATVRENRRLRDQLAHYAGHAYQIVLVAKHLKGDAWDVLSIPRGQSAAYEAKLRAATVPKA